MEINEKMVEEKQVAYIPVKGVRNKTNVYDYGMELIGELTRWAMSKDLQIAGTPYTIYYNNPMEVPPEKLVLEVGMPIVGEAQSEGKVKIKNIPAQMVLSTMFVGPYDNLGEIHMALGEYAEKNGYEIMGAPMDIYFNCPTDVSESELLTEVHFPVVKK